MSMDNTFGSLLRSIRTEKNIKAAALVRGLCDVAVLKRIENGEVLPGYLLRSALTNRLGLAPEWFENMLRMEEYDECLLRGRIIEAIENKRYEAACAELENYKCRHTHDEESSGSEEEFDRSEAEEKAEERLRSQFYYEMRCSCNKHQCISGKGDYNALAMEYRCAALMTSEAYDDRGALSAAKLGKYKLSIAELNLYVEAAWCGYLAAPEDGEKRAALESTLEILIAYLMKHYYDDKSRAKLYPKLAVYYCRLNEKKADTAHVHEQWKLCNDAFEQLRSTTRSYYMVELMDIRIALADKLCEGLDKEKQREAYSELCGIKMQTQAWRDVLAEEYRRRNVPVMMQDDCYLRYEGSVCCINDVIRARRSLYGYNRARLSEGICAEKTIEKTEQHRTNLQYTNMMKLYHRLGLPEVYQMGPLITGNFKALEMLEEVYDCMKMDKFGEADMILARLKSMVPDCAVNRQELGCAQVILENQLDLISTEEALERMFELLEFTLPLKHISKFIDNRDYGLMRNKPVGSRVFFTESEIYCLVAIGRYFSLLGKCKQADYFMKLLYEYLYDKIFKELVHGNISRYVDLVKMYSSLCGNMGQYAWSDRIADEAAARQLMERRLDGIWWHKYNNIWNADMQQSDTEKYNSGVRECIALCQICGAESAERDFNKAISKNNI